MKILFIIRNTSYSIKGGDTYQAIQTAKQLHRLNISVDIKRTGEIIDYAQYDLLHFFNLTRPADILFHISNTQKPFVASPIWIDYSEYDKYHRRGVPGFLFRFLSADAIEYLKTIARWLTGKDKLITRSYLWRGHRSSINEIVNKCALLLPNSLPEQQQLTQRYAAVANYEIVPNGIDTTLFAPSATVKKDSGIIVCVARIEGIKNQLNLIHALNNTCYQLLLIGSPAPNQRSYYRACRKAAANNITFIDHLPQEELVPYYQQAKVHVLPSWFETCGLSSLEAAAMGCNIVITDKGYTKAYYEDYAFYCDPASPLSIRRAIEKAVEAPFPEALRNKIIANYTWQKAAEKTVAAYRQVLPQL